MLREACMDKVMLSGQQFFLHETLTEVQVNFTLLRVILNGLKSILTYSSYCKP